MAVDLQNYAFSFSHATIKLKDKQYTAIKGIDFKQDVDRAAVYGTNRAPLKMSAGQLKLGDANVNFSDLEEAMTFYSDLGDDPSLAIFAVDFTVSNEAGQVRSFELLGCSLGGFSAKFEQGADALGLEMPIQFLRLKVDGKSFAQ